MSARKAVRSKLGKSKTVVNIELLSVSRTTGDIDKNPVSLIVRPRRVVVRETEAFTDREMKHLFEIVLEQAPILHKVTLLALFTTGMRNAEIRNIKLKDFQIHEGVRVLRYVGKGQKVNQISIHPATAHYLDLYLKWMEEKGRKIGPDDYLFQRRITDDRCRSSVS